MISKLRFSLIAVIMLVLVGFGFQSPAQGQPGTDNLLCPGVPLTTGFLETEIFDLADFSAGLIGTVEVSGGDLVGGLDWQHVDIVSLNDDGTEFPTNLAGSQLVSWWTQLDGRTTYLQVTNENPESDSGTVTLHVRILDSNCVEIRDFCDTYTENDTHEYNFGDLVSNDGADIPDANIQNKEGFVVITPVEDCLGAGETALNHNFLTGQKIIVDSDGYSYGANLYARRAICVETIDVDVNLVNNPSFLLGLNSWITDAQTVTTTDGQDISPPVDAPANDQDSDNMAFVIADASGVQYDVASGFTTVNGIGSLTNLTGAGTADANVALLESVNLDTVLSTDDGSLSYNIQFYEGTGATDCSNYVAVMLLQIPDPLDPATANLLGAQCYVSDAATTPGNLGGACTPLAAGGGPIAFNALTFTGRSGFQIGETVTRGAATGDIFIQVVAGQKTDAGCDEPTGALVNGFSLEGERAEDVCIDNQLTGGPLDKLDEITPDFLFGQFNVLPGNVDAGADVVLINFFDEYSPVYRPVGALVDYFVSIFDEDEFPVSCGDLLNVCFTRLGIDDDIVISDDFVPVTVTPTAPPGTPTPTPGTPTPTPATPTPTGGGGGSSSCAIAGSPVQLGTALANVLIPLVPVAFAFGVRAVRRRKK